MSYELKADRRRTEGCARESFSLNASTSVRYSYVFVCRYVCLRSVKMIYRTVSVAGMYVRTSLQCLRDVFFRIPHSLLKLHPTCGKRSDCGRKSASCAMGVGGFYCF